uniref:Uncharacterized protein n=1 Tax=Timema cristinae TaxID=61476 RepID=A0A7R9D9H8_TIMCR|nr:unnamed protein product [Timema cristinae]
MAAADYIMTLQNHPSEAETQPPPVISDQPSPPPDNSSTTVDSPGSKQTGNTLQHIVTGVSLAAVGGIVKDEGEVERNKALRYCFLHSHLELGVIDDADDSWEQVPGHLLGEYMEITTTPPSHSPTGWTDIRESCFPLIRGVVTGASSRSQTRLSATLRSPPFPRAREHAVVEEDAPTVHHKHPRSSPSTHGPPHALLSVQASTVPLRRLHRTTMEPGPEGQETLRSVHVITHERLNHYLTESNPFWACDGGMSSALGADFAGGGQTGTYTSSGDTPPLISVTGGHKRTPSLEPTIMTSHPEITTRRDHQWKNLSDDIDTGNSCLSLSCQY